MLVFADLLEEAGATELAAAYRWAHKRGKWPCHIGDGPMFRRTGGKIKREIYDWDSVKKKSAPVPNHSRLPHKLYVAICKLPNEQKRYGSINRAFVLLARGLKSINQEATAKA